METLCTLFALQMKVGGDGEEFSLYFGDEEMTPEYDIPPCEEGVGNDT